MSVSLRLNQSEESLFRQYAALRGITVSEMIRKAVLERIEDEYDMACYEKALAEFKKDPQTFTLDEVEKELGLA